MKYCEGKACLEYEPEWGVFLNPRGQLARSLGVLALRVFSKLRQRKLKVADAFTGVGTRAIRYLLEANWAVEWVYANDSSPIAISFAARNALNNGVVDRIKFHCMETRKFLCRMNFSNIFFDVIDLDVFGTPMPFVQFAITALKYDGAMYLTSTDTAPLCGINRRAAFRNYGAVAGSLEFCHEVGARIVIATVIKSAAQQAFIGRPLFTLFDGYSFRIFMEFRRGRGDFPADKIGFIFRCPSTCDVFWVKQKALGRTRLPCETELQVDGPLWLGELHDPDFLDAMLEELRTDWFSRKDAKKIEKRLKLMRTELSEIPFFYEISEMADREGIDMPKRDELVQELKKAGFKASVTQFSGTGIKTDAPYHILSDCALKVLKEMR